VKVYLTRRRRIIFAFIQKYIDNPPNAAGGSGYASRGLSVNDPQAIPQVSGIYHYYSDPSDKNRISMELHVEGGYVYVGFNENGYLNGTYTYLP